MPRQDKAWATRAQKCAVKAPGAADNLNLGDLATLTPDWRRSLRAEGKSPHTVTVYSAAADQLLAFLVGHGMPTDVARISRQHIETFVDHLLTTRSPATANNRYRALQRLFAFLVDEGEITDSPMATMHPPSVPEPETRVLSDDELRRLFATCDGKNFVDRRDTAMFRLLADTGCRSHELTSLRLEDLDRDAEMISVLGKDSQQRACPYGAKTAQAIDRYLRVRARHRLASLPQLWIGLRGPVTDTGLRQFLATRAKTAGLGHVHPHQLRHTYAHRWLAEGGQEGDLMRLAGLRSRTMLARYESPTADQQAREAYRRLSLGDRL